jgi:hypothetical protein
MAREEIPVTQITRAGAFHEPAVGIADGHKFINNGRCFAVVKNIDAVGLHAVTFISQKTVLGLTLEDEVVELAALEIALLGVWPSDVYNVSGGADDGMCYIDYEAGDEDQFEVTIYEL